MMMARASKDDLALLAELMQQGKVTPVIDKRYKLSEAAEAMRHLGKRQGAGEDRDPGGVAALRQRSWQCGQTTGPLKTRSCSPNDAPFV